MGNISVNMDIPQTLSAAMNMNTPSMESVFLTAANVIKVLSADPVRQSVTAQKIVLEFSANTV